MTNFRDWANVELNTKPDWKGPVKDALAFIGACTLLAVVLLLISYKG